MIKKKAIWIIFASIIVFFSTWLVVKDSQNRSNADNLAKIGQYYFLDNHIEEYLTLYFSLNKGTFFGDIPNEQLTDADYLEYAKRFVGILNEKHRGFATAEVVKAKEIVINIHIPDEQTITNDDYVDQYIDVLNTMYTAYLVSARIRK